jgi:hypothetical protein
MLFQLINTLAQNTPFMLCCVQANTKSGLFSSSNAAKEIKKATDTWAVGDSVKLQSAACAAAAGAVKPSTPAAAAPKATTGRKML